MTVEAAPKNMTRVQRKAFLKRKYFRLPRADILDGLLSTVVDNFDAGKLSGDRFEGSGLVVIGESGSGKSKEIDECLQRFMAEGTILECGIEKRILQYALDGETTWKALGLQLLERLGYPLVATRTEHEIWSRVRFQSEKQGIWLVHVDECQHMFQTLGEKETKKVINSIKTLMKHREWPLVVVLSGIPELLDKVNLDPQLRNLMTPYRLDRLDPHSSDLDEIDTAVFELAEAFGIDISEIRNEDTYLRLSYGHEDLYGKIFRFLRNAFGSLPDGETRMTVSHLADLYGQNTACSSGQNVFLREDYEACNVEVLMAGD